VCGADVARQPHQRVEDNVNALIPPMDQVREPDYRKLAISEAETRGRLIHCRSIARRGCVRRKRKVTAEDEPLLL
jgi:hypothetical protein